MAKLKKWWECKCQQTRLYKPPGGYRVVIWGKGWVRGNDKAFIQCKECTDEKRIGYNFIFYSHTRTAKEKRRKVRDK